MFKIWNKIFVDKVVHLRFECVHEMLIAFHLVYAYTTRGPKNEITGRDIVRKSCVYNNKIFVSVFVDCSVSGNTVDHLMRLGLLINHFCTSI